jgi:hypothetical protein
LSWNAQKVVQNLCTRFFWEVVRYGSDDFGENVHFCISLREMLKMPHHDAKKWQKKFASRYAP